MPSLIKGKQIENDTIGKGKLNLITPTVAKDPVTKGYFDARTINGNPLSSNIVLDKTDIGLSNVDNTTDLTKPVSVPQKTLIDTKMPFGTLAQLKASTDLGITSYQITDKGKEGIFVLDSSDTTSVNDDAMVIVSGTRRFKRGYSAHIYPEWFGAKADGVTDCADAIQAAFDYISINKGGKVIFGAGTYLISKTVTLKVIPNTGVEFLYSIDIQGAGISATKLRGTETFSGNLIEMKTGQANFSGRNNYASIRDMQIIARGADRCFFGNHLAGLNLIDISFIGGEIECVKLGSSNVGETSLNYSIYLTRCRFLGATKNGGNSQGNLAAHSCLFLNIDGAEGDGGKYGLYMNNCADTTIVNSKLEGYKEAAVYITGTNGAQYHKIQGNYFAAYAGYDPNSVFDGTMYGLLIKGTYPFGSSIVGNVFRVAETKDLPLVITNTEAENLSRSSTGDIITGTTSGATGYLQGLSTDMGRMLVQVISGTFVEGELFTHKFNNVAKGSGRIGTIKTNVTYGIKLEDETRFGSTTIIGNGFASSPDYGIHVLSSANRIIGNDIAGKIGLYIKNSGIVSGNTFYSLNGTPWINDGNLAEFINNNVSAGTQTGKQNNFKKGLIVNEGLDVTGGAVINTGGLDITGNVTLRPLSNLVPSNSDSNELGTLANIWKSITGFLMRVTSIRPINISGILLENQAGVRALRMFNDTAHIVIGTNGTTDDGISKLQVYGNTRLVGNLKWLNGQTAQDNADALAYGAAVGDIYKTPTGDLRVVV